MANNYFRFKEFIVHQDLCAMKVTTDACLFGAWVTAQIERTGADPIDGPIAPRILDIGAGTGLLALMIAQKTSGPIDAIELDTVAAGQAGENFSLSPWKERLRIFNGDILEFPLSANYSTIVSNPPFYENELRSPDERKNMAHHDGGLLLDKLAGIVKQTLAPGGRFYLLAPYKRLDEVERLLEENGLYPSKIVRVRPSEKHDYFRIMVEAEDRPSGQVQTEDISVWNAQQKYTPAFVELLKDYYLHL
jgi:tRNA1Val (adenine37-N6)-methyltransferase